LRKRKTLEFSFLSFRTLSLSSLSLSFFPFSIKSLYLDASNTRGLISGQVIPIETHFLKRREGEKRTNTNKKKLERYEELRRKLRGSLDTQTVDNLFQRCGNTKRIGNKEANQE